MKKFPVLLAALALAATLSACQPAAPFCASGALTYLEPGATPQPGRVSGAPTGVAAGPTTLKVDRVVSGYLCNNALSGSVYIACDVQVNRWVDKPLFLDGCAFTVAPGTVIYVAAHNNEAYYNGCAACHASSAKAP